jgi:tripartite-type tricarboxylate transporter receptor subunit TctC
VSGFALAAGLAPVRVGLTEEQWKTVRLVEPLGEQSNVWIALVLLRPALQRELQVEVAFQTVPGHDGFDAMQAVVAPTSTELRLFASPIMAVQYAQGIVKTDIRLEDLKPIVKLTNGFSVALFAKQGGPLKTWPDLATLKPLKMSTLPRATAGYVAALMMERKGAIATELTLRTTIAAVVDDVLTGHSSVGITRTTLVAKQRDRLQPIVCFGAERNSVLSQTPTFAEVVGNPKLAFTESLGVFASPKLEAAQAARVTKAFIAAGDDTDVLDRAEAANLPLAINGPDVLIDTMERNQRVLRRILS